MPLYDYQCTKCYKRKEIKMSFAEHEITNPMFNEKLICEECGYIMVQQVSKLNFKLEGQGWFGQSDTCCDAYGITEMEMRKNLDLEKRIEGESNEMAARDRANNSSEGTCDMM